MEKPKILIVHNCGYLGTEKSTTPKQKIFSTEEEPMPPTGITWKTPESETKTMPVQSMASKEEPLLPTGYYWKDEKKPNKI